MSTRSHIGIKDSRGITGVYCHFDGYPEGVGKTLLENYDTENKVKALIAEGDMSSLGATLEECNFYKEGPDTDPYTIPDCEDVREKYYQAGKWMDYSYLFEDGEWYFTPERIDHKSFNAENPDNVTMLPSDWQLLKEELRNE
jgi:hypothetical protein